VKGKFWLSVVAFALPVAFSGVTAVGQVAKPVAEAANTFQRYELYGGVAYSSANQVKGSSALIGYNLGADAKLKKWFGGVADYGWYGASSGVAKPTVTTFLAGPEFYIPSGSLTGFLHVMFGGAHTGYTGTIPDVSFAYAVGGGFSYKVRDHWAVRLSGDGIVSSFVYDPNKQNFSPHARANGRAVAGVAYRF
jgi:hypothetical protein